jgi:chromosome partitioning protein
MAVPTARLAKVLEETKKIGTEVLILDTALHSEGTALAAARSADLILVPCQPSIMDLRALRKTAELLQHVKKPTYVVLNGVASQGSVANEAAKAIIEEYNLPVAPIRLGNRIAFNRCLIASPVERQPRS